jgi:hypothetical protein
MISLLIAIAALSLAVIVSAIVEPWPAVSASEEDSVRMMDAVTLSA